MDEAEITMDTTFEDDLGADSWIFSRLSWGWKRNWILKSTAKLAADIVTVGDAVEAIKMVKKNKNDKSPL